MSKSVKKIAASDEEKKSGEEIKQKNTSAGKTAKQLVNKHIRDENDVITEEDFRNLKIDLEIPGDTAHQPVEIADNPERPKDEDKDPPIITAWDVIS